MSDTERKAQSLDFLRRAVNLAISAGNRPEEVETVVDDQIFGIVHLGNGDPNQMIRREREEKRDLIDKIKQLRERKNNPNE